MNRFEDLRILWVAIALLSSACERMKPESIGIASYPEIDLLLSSQTSRLQSRDLDKQVWLDGKNESKQLQMDSLSWATELSFLKEINPNQPEYVGAFDKEESEDLIVLILGEKESGSLNSFSFTSEKGGITSIKATIHEDKDVYVHHRDINLTLTEGSISRYQIDGYQKIMLKDTIRFRILGSIVD
ncbi:MAG: hypothetical protein ABJG78_16945 [Cyclobacteriaceae bacterium]